MKKNFIKKLALVMALTVAATSVPATNAEAASTPNFRSKAANLTVGQTKNYGVTDGKRWSVKFKIGNTKIATIDWKQGDKKVAVTGEAEGTTTLRADFKAYKTKRTHTERIKVYVKAAEVEVPEVVEAELADVKQTAANAFELSFTADATGKFNKESIGAIESVDGKFTLAVNKFELSTDGKTATVTTFGNFQDKVAYNVTVGGKTVVLNATVGAVHHAEIVTKTATVNNETPIEFKLYDANNVDVTSTVSLSTYVSLFVEGSYVDYNVANPARASIKIGTPGDIAKVTLVYDPLTNVAGSEVMITGEIRGIAAVQTAGTEKMTLAAEDTHPKFYLEKTFEEDTTIAVGDAGESIYLVALNGKKDAIEYDSFTARSSNEDVLAVSEINDATNSKYAEFNVNPVAAGKATVIIEGIKNGVSTVYTRQITVTDTSYAKTLKLSTKSLNVSNTVFTEDYEPTANSEPQRSVRRSRTAAMRSRVAGF